jgi:hypothetical protein
MGQQVEPPGGYVFLIRRSRSTLRRQTRLAPYNSVANALLQSMADTALNPAIVLASIAFLLGGTNRQIAAFMVIAVGSWTLAPLVLMVIRSIVGRPYPLIFAAAAIRLGAIATIGWAGLQIDDWSTSRTISTLVGAYLVYQVASSITSQASVGLLASALRGTSGKIQLRWRAMIALGASLVVGWIAWSILDSGQAFQDSVGNLLILSTLAVAGATWFLLSIPAGQASTPAPRPRRLWGTLGSSFSTPAFRRYVSFKLLLAMVAAMDPFLIVYGFLELNLELRYVGWALLAWTTGQVVGNLLWPKWVARTGPRIPFQIATTLRLLLLLLVVSLPSLATSDLYLDRFDGPEPAMRFFASSFALLGLAASTGNTANQRYLMDVSPRGESSGTVFAANLVAAIGAFFPLVAAWSIDRYDLDWAFWGAIGLAVLTLIASGLLPNSRVRVRRATGSWRQRSSPQTI